MSCAFAGCRGQLNDAVTQLKQWLDTHPERRSLVQAGRDPAADGEGDAAPGPREGLETTEPDAILANNMAWLYLDRNPDRHRAGNPGVNSHRHGRRSSIPMAQLYRTGRKNDGLAAPQQALIIAPRNPEIARMPRPCTTCVVTTRPPDARADRARVSELGLRQVAQRCWSGCAADTRRSPPGRSRHAVAAATGQQRCAVGSFAVFGPADRHAERAGADLPGRSIAPPPRPARGGSRCAQFRKQR